MAQSSCREWLAGRACLGSLHGRGEKGDLPLQFASGQLYREPQLPVCPRHPVACAWEPE